MAEDAPRAKVSASTQGGYARLLFDWPEQANGSAELSGGVLVISFDKSFNADVDALSRTLEPYAALVRADPDGKALRIALKGPVRLKSNNIGSRFSFDLIPPGFNGDPPPPAAPTTAVQGPPTLVVRATEREQTTRLQFDFPGKAAYAAKLEGGKLRVTFAKDARVDLKRFTDAPPAWVRGVVTSSSLFLVMPLPCAPAACSWAWVSFCCPSSVALFVALAVVAVGSASAAGADAGGAAQAVITIIILRITPKLRDNLER